MASSGSISEQSARTSVVLPAPWPPETTMLLRARTAALRKEATTGVSIARSTRSSSVTSMSRWRRITTDGRGVTQAAAASREPPSSRKCSRGCASENPRALTSLREARKTRKSMSSSSESATAGPSIKDPSMSSSSTLSYPVMMMFSKRSSSTNGWSRPSRNSESNTALAKPSCSATGHAVRPALALSAAADSIRSSTMERPSSS